MKGSWKDPSHAQIFIIIRLQLLPLFVKTSIISVTNNTDPKYSAYFRRNGTQLSISIYQGKEMDAHSKLIFTISDRNTVLHRGEAVLRKHLRTFEENQISNIIRREPRVKRH